MCVLNINYVISTINYPGDQLYSRSIHRRSIVCEQFTAIPNNCLHKISNVFNIRLVCPTYNTQIIVTNYTDCNNIKC